MLESAGVEGEVSRSSWWTPRAAPTCRTLKILKSTNELFAQPSRTRCRRMRFYPAQKSADSKVKQLVQQPFTFSIVEVTQRHSIPPSGATTMNMSLTRLFCIDGRLRQGHRLYAARDHVDLYSLSIMIQKWWDLRTAQARDAQVRA